MANRQTLRGDVAGEYADCYSDIQQFVSNAGQLEDVDPV
jgi:hypothetical protein